MAMIKDALRGHYGNAHKYVASSAVSLAHEMGFIPTSDKPQELANNTRDGTASEDAETDDTPATDAKLQQPSKEAIATYRFYTLAGKTQQEAADILTKEFKKPISQGQVSKWVKQTGEWVERGNVLPNPDTPPVKTYSVDPSKLDLGARVDPRKPRPQDLERHSRDS